MVHEKDPREAEGKADDPSRIDGYLQGNADAYAEIESWILIELRRRYARLRSDHGDLVQSVHARLLANLRQGRFEGRSSLRTYVTGIAHYTAIDRLRELYQQRALAETATEPTGREQGNPYIPLAATDERRMLYQVLLTLPASCRELWRLVFVDRLGYDEVAARLSVPAGTVKSRMWHCRRKAMAALARQRRRGAPRRPKRKSNPARSLTTNKLE